MTGGKLWFILKDKGSTRYDVVKRKMLHVSCCMMTLTREATGNMQHSIYYHFPTILVEPR